MKTEKQKMLSGEGYLASDPELVADRLQCRKDLQAFNRSLPESDEWQKAMDSLFPNKRGSFYVEPPFFCDYGSNIHWGDNVYLNFNCTILDVARVTIGDNVMMATGVQILTATHPTNAHQRVVEGVESGEPIVIGDNAWLGAGVLVLPGITIGENTVVGAGSVVTKDLPANVVAAGNPCRVIREVD